MSDKERIELAAKILDDWATAIWGDWENIDGRICRDELNTISAYLRGEQDDLTHADAGVCMEDGNAHWDDHWFTHWDDHKAESGGPE